MQRGGRTIAPCVCTIYCGVRGTQGIRESAVHEYNESARRAAATVLNILLHLLGRLYADQRVCVLPNWDAVEYMDAYND